MPRAPHTGGHVTYRIVMGPGQYGTAFSAERAWRMLRYQGGRTFDAFLKFLEDQLEADKGFARSPALDELAVAWLDAAPGGGQEGLIAKVRTLDP